MKRAVPFGVVALVSMVSVGCAPPRPPQELVDARAAYARAYVGPAAEANTVGLVEARHALDEAEAKYADDPKSEEARHLAYVAHRRVLLAETNARATIAATQKAQAEQALAEVRARTKLDEDRPADDRQKARVETKP
jgi:hypothetical protein